MKDLSIYVGIVIQNNDPEQVGRVKVFVPGITNTIEGNWNGDLIGEDGSLIAVDKSFSLTSDPDFKPILVELQEDLPWASSATSIFGGDVSTITTGGLSEVLERPSNAIYFIPPIDKFENEKYTPGDYSGTPAGTFSIPSVGSHVYVFFKGGDLNHPVYFASAHNSADWSSIYGINYPTDYENAESPTSTYENKHVINTTKHTLEFIDSDEKEEIKLSHFSGSNIQILNDYTSKFTVKDDYTLVQENRFETVGKDLSITVGGNIVITNGGGTITIDSGGNIKIECSGTMDLNSGGAMNITAGGNMKLSAPKIDLN